MKAKTKYSDLTTLLYIEPSGKRSTNPVLDDITKKMTAALRRYVDTGVLSVYCAGSEHESALFTADVVTKGSHRCACGHGWSSNYDYVLIDGSITNSMAIHYLAYHRNECPQEALDIIASLPYAGEDPDLEELQGAIWLSAERREGVNL